jgi:hypothetical protein
LQKCAACRDIPTLVNPITHFGVIALFIPPLPEGEEGILFFIPPLPEGGGGVYCFTSVRPSFRPSKIFFVAFFSVAVDGRNLGYKKGNNSKMGNGIYFKIAG